eukprot:m.1619215 g.1619215  ORF g.1619215 m.1619215 type:complete len:106 (-) comp25380_c1_seq1:1106-1423(-)
MAKILRRQEFSSTSLSPKQLQYYPTERSQQCWCMHQREWNPSKGFPNTRMTLYGSHRQQSGLADNARLPFPAHVPSTPRVACSAMALCSARLCHRTGTFTVPIAI